jgi:hypothetical protein
VSEHALEPEVVAPAPAPRPRPRLRGWLLPVAVSALIVAWQAHFLFEVPAPKPEDSISASVGLLPDMGYFFYFYYHLGLFPVGAKDVPRLGKTRQDALDFVAHHGDRLRMDFGESLNTPRFGDYGKLFLLWPDAWLRGEPRRPSATPFNEALFIGSLLAVWWAFWRERRALLGGLVVLFAGSDPFQILETYLRPNIFSVPISAALLALAACLPYLGGRRGADARAWITAVVAGVALATLREIRIEAAIIAVAVVATWLTMRAPWSRRLGLASLFVVAFAATGSVWAGYWSRGFERSAVFVEKAGGRAFAGRHSLNHALWHAVYCGLGDFGGDKGFEWDDRLAFRWSTTLDPATNPKPIPYTYRHGYYFEQTYDGIHPIAPTDLPEYNRLVRDRVLRVVREDPLWYARVLLQRVGAVLGRATPAAISVGVAQIRVPGVGWLLVPLLLLLLVRRRAFEAKLVAFALPLSAVALVVYSGRGTTNYGIAHLISLAVAVDWLVRAYRARRKRQEVA